MLKHLHLVSSKLLELLEQGLPEFEKRDQYIEKIHILLDERDKVFSALTDPASEADEKLGQELVELERKISAKLTAMHAALKSEQKQMKEQKKVNQHYQDSFSHEPNDGYFLDKRQ